MYIINNKSKRLVGSCQSSRYFLIEWDLKHFRILQNQTKKKGKRILQDVKLQKIDIFPGIS